VCVCVCVSTNTLAYLNEVSVTKEKKFHNIDTRNPIGKNVKGSNLANIGRSRILTGQA
jgi:hypothetical protein